MSCPNCPHPHDPSTSCNECFCAGTVAIDDSSNFSPRFVPGEGSGSAQIMIVGEAPGKNEEMQGRPFVGESGSILNQALQAVGISRSEVYITNAIKVRPPNNDLKRLPELGFKVSDFQEELWNEIRQINPNVIVPMGNVALGAVCGKTGILHYRGSILPAIDSRYKCVPTVHPANFLYSRGTGGLDYSYRVVFNFDLKRAREESLEFGYRPPTRYITICKSSYQLQEFIDRHRSKGLRRAAIDIETLRCIPVCIAIAFDRHSAMSVPLLDVQNWYKQNNIGDYDMNEIWKILIQFFDEFEIIGQNLKFDHDKIETVCSIPVPNVYGDTMFLAHAIHPELPKSLEFLTSIYTREPYYKSEGKEFNIKKDDISKLYLYNAKDAAVTIEAHEEMLIVAREQGVESFYFGHLMPLHKAYMDIESVGFKVDEEKREELKRKYKGLLHHAEDEFESLTKYKVVDADEQKEIKKREKKEKISFGPNINLNSPAQLSDLLYEHLGFPERDSTDEDTLVALLGNHTSDPIKQRILELIIDIRRYRKTISTYLSAVPDYDGRMRTSYRVVGAETGRTSTSKQGPPVRPEPMGAAFQVFTKHGDIGPEIREMYVPDKGYAFVEADLSQAEPRIVANLSNDDETLKLFETSDIHTLTASWIFDKDPKDINRKTERFIGKTCRNAGNYDTGKRRFTITVNTDARKFHIPIKLTEHEGGRILTKFHQFSPKIRRVFHVEIREALEQNGRVLINPYGRRRQFLGRWGDDLYKEAYAHIPQSTVRDKMVTCLLSLRKQYPHIRIVLEAHDALVALVPLNLVEEYSEAMDVEFAKPIDFSRCSLPRNPLSIPAEVQVAYENYRDFKTIRKNGKKVA